MKKLKDALCAVCLLTFTSAVLLPGTVSAGTGNEWLNAFFNEVKGFRAEFQQTVFDEQFRQIQASSGKMVLLRPGLFRWDYRQPYEQLIVGDGEKIWIYDADLEQVTVKSQSVALGETPAQLLSSADPLEKSFTVTELGSQQGTEWVELTPVQEDTAFTTVRLAFRERELVKMEMHDSLGNRTIFEFSNVERNPGIDKSAFVFTPPAGVDVIGQ